MTLESELQYFEVLPSEPPESRPKATKAWQDLKVLATTAVLVEADRHFRRVHRAVNTRIRRRSRH